MIDFPFTLNQLKILKAIVLEGSFKRAADSVRFMFNINN